MLIDEIFLDEFNIIYDFTSKKLTKNTVFVDVCANNGVVVIAVATKCKNLLF